MLDLMQIDPEFQQYPLHCTSMHYGIGIRQLRVLFCCSACFLLLPTESVF